MFLGDLVDRGSDVKGTVGRVIELLTGKPGSVCVMGNHDFALVNAAGLAGPPDAYWVDRYRSAYDSDGTFMSYLGRAAERNNLEKWASDLAELRQAMPGLHREFLACPPWVAEAAGHLFLHNGLSRELNEPAESHRHVLRARRWAEVASPRVGTKTFDHWQTSCPVWLGADRRANADQLPVPGNMQVVGHVQVTKPELNAVRLRLDTSGGVSPPLTAALFRGPDEPPEYLTD
ncbi:MAG: hypothetical protein MUF18_12880 [Fimbriiglobus sp.]|nr:hypothetical protein [Fimbriiglobus sp.]